MKLSPLQAKELLLEIEVLKDRLESLRKKILLDICISYKDLYSDNFFETKVSNEG